jgi:hypothetical protein
MQRRLYAAGSIIALLLVLFPLGMNIASGNLIVAANHTEANNMVSEAKATDTVNTILGSQFFENVGQFPNERVLFYGRIQGGFIGFSAGSVLLWMNGASAPVEMTFVGAGMIAPSGTCEVAHHTNYFLGDRGTFTGVRGFAHIVYDGLWPGIDLDYQVTTSGVKYEFRIAPGANPSDITIKISGHDLLKVDSRTVVLEKNDVTILDEGLKVFQEDIVVDADFEALDTDMFGYRIGAYDTSRELVIDPLLYSTYLGGSAADEGVSIDVRSNGDVFVLISTESTDIDIMVDGITPFNATANGMNDVLVAKLAPNLGSLIYATYVGGTEDDIPYGIAVDSTGIATVVGQTYSNDFPIITGPLPDDVSGFMPLNDTSKAGTTDAFIFRLDMTGESIHASSFIGGGQLEAAHAIAVDDNQIFIAGITSSFTFPRFNAFDDTYDGSVDAFVMRLRSFPEGYGFGIMYSTYLGGAGQDVPYSIAIDSNKNAFIVGYTNSDPFPTNHTIGTRGGDDAFVVEVASDGQFQFSTVICGEDTDRANDVTVDALDRIYITGGTFSDPFEAVDAADIYGPRGDSDCFVIVLDSTGESVLHSFLVSGDSTDVGLSIALDSTGNGIYVGGRTNSDNFPTPNGNYTERQGWADGFLLKIGSTGLQYSTYVGGDSEDRITAIAIDSDNHILATGFANETIDFPTTDGAYQETHGGERDAFVFKHAELIKPTLNHPPDESFSETGVDIVVVWTANDDHPGSYEVVGNWTSGNPPRGPLKGSWTSDDDITFYVDGLKSGSYALIITVTDLYGNTASDTVMVRMNYDPIPDLIYWSQVIGALVTIGGAIGLIIRRVRRKGGD